ncbi:oxidoreductase [Advenella kashmirensis W13003]|uniref:Oxidoreductase n=1 Tax=Advenella kashmirensis W13003 TaxID=1424334 RepID=V8QQ40_9BURK|nr:MaoC family dehydratase [Advenella kashmirensis]ETF02061.1 oxidoreductase [Advenella kashmirensis W13003]
MTNPIYPARAAPRTFDSVQSLTAFVGQPGIISPAIQVDQETITRFGCVTHDSQWIHVDRERARAESPYQDTIAHGFLVLALLTHLQAGCIAFPGARMALNYGFDKVRFTAPVPVDSFVSATFSLTDVTETAPGEARCCWHVTLQADKADRPSLYADWLILIRFDKAGQT